ncbi:MAG: CBS domain-containing protein, partial [Anaerolineae bacterium]
IQPSATVAQIMSYGVHTMGPDTTVDDAAEEMLRYGFEGFPIVDEWGEILGILTRREIDRARRLRLGNMPVSHYMTKGNIHVSPSDSVEQLQQVMTRHGVGQVPVVEGGEILGVVTRTDLIKLWAAPPRQPPRPQEIAKKMEGALPGPLLQVLQRASELAQELGYPLYVVGGFVRDLLLGEPNLDMDLVVEGDAVRFARRLARQIDARTRSHRRFGTAKIILEDREDEFGVPSLDFAAARLEFYSHSAALPEVERSSIKADLHRRDFTINTLAIRLDSGHYGVLLDFYGGEQDLKDGLIRVLHSLSFIEDPTRIMRAVRFEQRLGFAIEARTEELIENALPMLARVTGERIRHELYLILEEKKPELALCRLDALGVLSRIHRDLSCTERTCALFEALRQAVAEGGWEVTARVDSRPGPRLYLALLAYDLLREDLEGLARRLKFFRQDLTLLQQVLALRESEERLEHPDLSNREIYGLLRHSSSEARLVQWVATDSERVRQRLWCFETELRHVEPIVDGEYLKSLGLKPSPLFSRLLRSVRDARLDGKVQSLEEEKAFIDRLLSERERV